MFTFEMMPVALLFERFAVFENPLLYCVLDSRLPGVLGFLLSSRIAPATFEV